jgi:deoxyribonuclease-2
MAISAIDENGNPVDWWFMYKVSGESETSDGRKIYGTEYVYFDSNSPADGKLIYSKNTVDKDGALPNTLAQIYENKNENFGWYFYNDEDPITGKTNGERGHTKGVVAFDLDSNSAIRLIHSTPKFALKGTYGYPETGMKMAQTLLCITLQNADVSQAIAKQMYSAQQPNVYLASDIPASLKNEPNDPRVLMIQNQASTDKTPLQTVLPFYSKGGTKFLSIAKNKYWGLDFYNDLVGPTLHENLEVETWEHDPTPLPADSDKVHDVVAMKSVNLDPLGLDIAWSEEDDHAKLAISDKKETVHYVCVGDINFTVAQEKRGGGTVAFQCDPLWNSISEILESVSLPPKKKTAKKNQIEKRIKESKL